MQQELKQTQIAIMFRDSYGGSFESVMDSVKEKIGTDLNANFIPVPDDAPAEIPRLELSNETKTIRFTKNRADFVVRSSNGIEDADRDKFLEIISGLKLSIKRVGIARQVIYTADEGVSVDLLNKNLRLEGLNSNELLIKEATWRINRESTIKHGDVDFSCNNITQISYGLVDDHRAIILVRDVNTTPDKDLEILINTASLKNVVTNLCTEAGTDFGMIMK